MTASVVQFVENDDASGSAPAYWEAPSITPASGNTLVAALWYYNDGGANELTFTLSDSAGGNDTWTLITSSWNGATDSGLLVWKLTSAAATATTVRFAPSSQQAKYSAAVVIEVTGDTGTVVGSAIQHQASPGTGTDGVTSGNTGTLSAQPALVIGITQNEYTDATPAVGTGYTSIGTGWDYGGGTAGSRFEWKRVTATTAVAGTFTSGSGSPHYTLVIALEETGGGGGTPGAVFSYHYGQQGIQ